MQLGKVEGDGVHGCAACSVVIRGNRCCRSRNRFYRVRLRKSELLQVCRPILDQMFFRWGPDQQDAELRLRVATTRSSLTSDLTGLLQVSKHSLNPWDAIAKRHIEWPTTLKPAVGLDHPPIGQLWVHWVQAERVVARIRDSATHLHVKTTVDNAAEVVEYLQDAQSSINPPRGSFLAEDNLAKLTDISDATEALARVRRDFSWDPWFDADKHLPRRSKHPATVVNVVTFGCFVELSDGIHGLVHNSHMNGHIVGLGDRVEVEVIWVDSFQKKMSLNLLEVIQEDAGDLFGPANV